MIMPVRCFSCGKPVAGYHDEIQSRVKKGEKWEDIFQELGITRYCCRRMLRSHVELIDDVMRYNV
ncbi:MAG: DNA-directed RNA polymerase subunit N [Candidatus Diapherotrites archaeon]|nr:DNA-directed RNA polymerase subunit N [Candidatus Diapherotrites archaeon]MDZ4256801.1 DNA-directed RNA polymerase subunit N [archaeon]